MENVDPEVAHPGKFAVVTATADPAIGSEDPWLKNPLNRGVVVTDPKLTTDPDVFIT